MTAAPRASAARRSAPNEGLPRATRRRYGAAMTTSALSVITAMDHRKPGLKPAKQRLLLFFAQGHHLAWAGAPLFDEALIAIDRGVTVETATAGGAGSLPPNDMLVTIGSVVTRYAQLSAAELRILIRASEPWRNARKADNGAHVDPAELRAWFLRDDETDDPDDERPTRAERAEAEAHLP